MTELAGIDISHWQSGIDLTKLSGIDFAIMKATDGIGWVDDHCDIFVNQAKKAGLKWGVYHFYEGQGASEADYFLSQIGGYIGEGLLALDFETHTSDVKGAKAFLDRVHDKTGVKPVIYFNRSVLTGNDWSSVEKADYGLWYARYTSSLDSTSPWAHPALWQYTSTGRVSGYSGDLDLDTFYGDKAAWDAYAKGSATPDPKPDPDPKPPSGDVTVDGIWGSATTKLAQQVYGTTVDSKVSGQDSTWKSQNPGLTSGWEWKSGSGVTGSDLMVAIQAEFGVSPRDGLIGPSTIKAMEKHYGLSQDGHLDAPSETIKAFQRTLNAGKKK